MSEVFLSRGEEESEDEELKELEEEIKSTSRIQTPSLEETLENKEVQEIQKRKVEEQGLSLGCPTPELMEEEQAQEELENIAHEELSLLGIKEEDLDFDISNVFSSEYSVKKGEQTIIYVGKVFGLHIDPKSQNFCGDITLTKYVQTTAKRKSSKLWFWKKQNAKIIWKINPNPSNWYSFGNPQSQKYNSQHYKSSLKNHAFSNYNKILKDELLESVFGLIDKKLEKIYNHLKGI